MNNDLDYRNIRPYEGSTRNGFEELVCQLAHLSPPENADFFVRKDGSGGDAGVECFWKLKDGSEHAWQAKYFLDPLKYAQWQQITKSVKKALDKHPKLTKYYICIPRDRIDSRGKNQKNPSELDQWNKYKKKWIETAKGMDVEFEFWGKHELNLKLSNESDPHFSGRALFWFKEPLINLNKLKKIANKSCKTLGERYTEESHLDLPIAKKLDGVGLTPNWQKDISQKVSELSGLKNEFYEKFMNNKTNFSSDAQILQNIYDFLNKDFLSFLFSDTSQEEKKASDSDKMNITEESILKNRDKVLSDISKLLDHCFKFIYKQQVKQTSKNEDRGILHEMMNQFKKVKKIENFFKEERTQGKISKAMLIQGEAGIGKSHLLCDISLKRLDLSLPTLFILGQHYRGGDPLDFLLERLDLKQFSKEQVLGALDAFGETYQSRFLIIIDAINEGHKEFDWHAYLTDFLLELSNFKNIGVVLSCRDTFIKNITPDELDEKNLIRIEHHGFKGFEHMAATKYFNNYGIFKPSVPIMAPEFSNPLFVKVCCKALKQKGCDSFPKGLRGLTKIFDFYVKSVEEVINRKKRYLPEENIVEKAINSFVDKLFPNNLSGLPTSEVRDIIDSCDSKKQSSESLTDFFINEGLLSLDIDYSKEERGSKIVRFTYEKFSDYFIAQNLTKKYKNTEDLKSFVNSYFKDGFLRQPRLEGIFQALGVIVPEKYGDEFIDLLPSECSDRDYEKLFDSTFFQILKFRSSDSFSDRTLELFNKERSNRKKLDMLFYLATEPHHPWNARFLDEKLMRKKLPERDHFWSIHVALANEKKDEYQEESILRTILNWSLDADLENVDKERLELTAIVLLWTTTCTNQEVRDDATIGLSRIFSYIPDKIPEFIKKYKNANDPYLAERLYASIYGAVLVLKEDKLIKNIADIVYKTVFEDNKPYPHILMRDYARGILEYANHKKLLDKNIDVDTFKPPYKSDWPIENPSQKEINKLEDHNSLSNIKDSVMSSLGDFGKYTMRCVHNWSSIPLTEKLKTGRDIHIEFANNLSKNLKSKYLNYISQSQIERNQFQSFFEGTEETSEETEETRGEKEKLFKDIKKTLDEEGKEYFRWLSGISIDSSLPAFSRKWAQRWVCKKAYELGWSKKLFGEFEKRVSNIHYSGDERRIIERIGKKYQWIAFHELLARMSDNLHWIDKEYLDADRSKFYGPWQINKRDIDPTFWRLKNKNSNNTHNKPLLGEYNPSFDQRSLNAMEEWLWDENIIPLFSDLIRVSSEDDKKWIALQRYWNKSSNHNESGKTIKQYMWVRINSIIIEEKDLELLKSNIATKKLEDPSIIKNPETSQSFFREFPWHPCHHECIEGDWIEFCFSNNCKIKCLRPVVSYYWEYPYRDYSISFYMPSKTLIKELNLSPCIHNESSWEDSDNKMVFVNPDVNVNFESDYALINEELLQKWLNEKDLILVWLIGGEKQLHIDQERSNMSCPSTLIYNKFIHYKEGILNHHDTWFYELREKGRVKL